MGPPPNAPVGDQPREIGHITNQELIAMVAYNLLDHPIVFAA